MSQKLLDSVLLLISLLEIKMGFHKIENSTSESFGNRVLVFKLDQFQIRVFRDRGIWSVEFSESNEPSYTALLRHAVDGSSGKDELSIEEEVQFWEIRWADVCTFFERDAQAAHMKIDQLALEISKRRNPTWYQ